MAGLGYVFIALMFGLGGALIARVKGNPVFLWFLIAFLVPFVGLLAALLARSDNEEPRRVCDGCGKQIPVSVTFCTSCGFDLDFPDEQLPSRGDQVRAQGR
jgi:hypothetical protein